MSPFAEPVPLVSTLVSLAKTTLPVAVKSLLCVLYSLLNASGGTITLQDVQTDGDQSGIGQDYTGGSIILNSTYTTSDDDFVATGPVHLGTGPMLVETFGGDITFNSAVVDDVSTDSSFTLNASGGTITLNDVSTDGAQSYTAGTIQLNSTYTTSADTFTATGPVQLVDGPTTTINTNDGNVLFTANITDPGDPSELIINAGAGTITLQSVTTVNKQDYTGGLIRLNSAYNTSNRSFTVTGPVELGDGPLTAIDTSGGNVLFTAGITDVDDPDSLIIDAGGGTITLQDVQTDGDQSGVGQDYTGGSIILNSTYTTSDDDFVATGPVHLGTGPMLVETFGGDITFNSAVVDDVSTESALLFDLRIVPELTPTKPPISLSPVSTVTSPVLLESVIVPGLNPTKPPTSSLDVPPAFEKTSPLAEEFSINPSFTPTKPPINCPDNTGPRLLPTIAALLESTIFRVTAVWLRPTKPPSISLPSTRLVPVTLTFRIVPKF